MDPYEPLYGLDAFPQLGLLNRRDNPLWEPIRGKLGYALRYAYRMNLATAVSHNDLALTVFA